MSMKVLLEVQLKPDGLDESYQGVHETLAETRTKPGMISAEVLVDETDPTRVVVVETWETAKDHDDYLAWRATPEGAPLKLAAAIAAAPITRAFIERGDL